MIRFTLILSSELNDWLKTQAKHYNRSKNQHIAFLLQAIRETAEQNQERLSKVDFTTEALVFGGLGDDNESNK